MLIFYATFALARPQHSQQGIALDMYPTSCTGLFKKCCYSVSAQYKYKGKPFKIILTV